MCSLLTILLQTTRSQLPCSQRTVCRFIQRSTVCSTVKYQLTDDTLGIPLPPMGAKQDQKEKRSVGSCSLRSHAPVHHNCCNFFITYNPFGSRITTLLPTKAIANIKKRLCFKSSKVISDYFLSNFRYTALSHCTFYKNL